MPCKHGIVIASPPCGRYGRMACQTLQQIPGHITTALHQQIMGIATLRISAPKVDPGRPEPAHRRPRAMVHSQQIWGAALVIPGLVKVGPARRSTCSISVRPLKAAQAVAVMPVARLT